MTYPTYRGLILTSVVVAAACGRAEANSTDTVSAVAMEAPKSTARELTRDVALGLIRADSAWRRAGDYQEVFVSDVLNESNPVYEGPCVEYVPESRDSVFIRMGILRNRDAVSAEGDTTCVREAVRSQVQAPPPDFATPAVDSRFISRQDQSFVLQVRTYRYELGSITGIVQEEGSTTAEAEFSWRRRQAPLASFHRGAVPQGGFRGAAQFRRYDDGWRLVRLSF